MAQLVTRVDFHLPLTVMCASLAKLRGDLVWGGLPENIPVLLRNMLKKAGLGRGCYSYWGKGIFNEILGGQVAPEIRIGTKLCGTLQCIPSDKSFEYLNMWSQTVALELNHCLKPILQSYNLSETVEIILFPINLCPPPQLGRFGAIVQGKSKTTVMLGFGVPDPARWYQYQLTIPFLAFGALFYIVRKWLEFQTIPQEVSPEVVRHLPHMIPQFLVEGATIDNKDNTSFGELPLLPWLTSLWQGMELGWNSLNRYVDDIINAWPHRIYKEDTVKENPGAIWEALGSNNSKLGLENPYGFSVDVRWLKDYCSLEKQADFNSHSILVAPWDSQIGIQKCHENGLSFANGYIFLSQSKVDPKFANGAIKRTAFAVDSIAGIILDKPLSPNWNLVFLSPPNICTQIDGAAITHIESPIALFDLKTGYRVA